MLRAEKLIQKSATLLSKHFASESWVRSCRRPMPIIKYILINGLLLLKHLLCVYRGRVYLCTHPAHLPPTLSPSSACLSPQCRPSPAARGCCSPSSRRRPPPAARTCAGLPRLGRRRLRRDAEKAGLLRFCLPLLSYIRISYNFCVVFVYTQFKYSLFLFSTKLQLSAYMEGGAPCTE